MITFHLKNMRAGRILRQGSAVNAFDSLIVEVACPEFIEGPSRETRTSVDWKKIFWVLLLGVGINAWGMESNKGSKKGGNKESASDRIKKEYSPYYQDWLLGTRQAHSAERLSFFISFCLYQGLHKLLHEDALKKSTEALVNQVAINSRVPFDPMVITFENKVKLPLQEAERQLRQMNLKIQQLQALRDEVALEMAKKSRL